MDWDNLSPYKAMWLFAMFDLPVDTPAGRKQYTRFRKMLLRQGFSMLQYSVYARFCASEESAKIHCRIIAAGVPPLGQVRLLMVTDRQFAKMDVFVGKERKEPENEPVQLEFL